MESLSNSFIERIQVDEGFLDGLDLRLGRGLTVVIGARGTGKTSILELVRYCLNADSFTDDARMRAHQQALSVLDGGQVTLTLSDGRERSTVARSDSDAVPRSISNPPDVTILSQSEIEAVGAQSGGRLHLVDRLIPDRRDFDRGTKRLRTEIRSVTIEIRDLLIEVDSMEEAVARVRHVPDELQETLQLEASALESVQANEADKKQLASLQNASAQTKVQQGVFERALSELELLDSNLNGILKRPILAENWPESAGKVDLLSPLRVKVTGAVQQITDVRQVIAETLDDIQSNITDGTEKIIKIDQASRELRRRLDDLEAGIGAITRRVEELREKAGQLSALRQRLTELRAHINRRIEFRDKLYRDLDQLHDARFSNRVRVANSLTAALAPSIQVIATRSEQIRPYAEAIVGALRGSGLHYNSLSRQIAAFMSPLELIQAVEARNPLPIAEAAEVTLQRASATIDNLKGSDLASIVAAPIDDGVTLELLDGAVFKDSENVSIGQRCTTVLPILLVQHGGILMVDQPEDHLDNSFIAGTVVTALQHRHPEDQLIFTSHNANIPVLGNADLVVVLDSDGKRGFVKHSGPLEDPKSVKAINDVMEGGAEAFFRRAEFYGGSVGKT